MLTQSSVVIGTNIAEILTESGVRLAPKNMTLLNEVNNALLNNMLYSNTPDRSMIEPSLISASRGNEETVAGTKSYKQSTHDTFMDNYIQDLSKLVTGYISFARSVVNKEINLLKENLQEGLSSYKYKEPEDFFAINYFKLDDVYNSFVVSGEIGSYADSSNKFFFDSMNLKKITEEDFDLGKYLLIGDSEQDNLTTAWLGRLGQGQALGYIINQIPEYNLSTDELLDYSLVNYLFYRNLTERTDIELGLTVATLKSKASANKDYFGNKLAVALELYRKDIRIGRILSSSSDVSFSYFNTKPLVVTVYEENFAKLAEAGASIEVLFGYISSGSGGNDVTVDQLIGNAELYLSKWNTTRSLYLISLNNNRLDVFKHILRGCFEASITREDVAEDEKAFLNENSGFINETRDLGNAYIDQLHISDIDDIDTITLDLVAKIRYRFTNAYYILKEMFEIMKLSDKMEPMEAALYAVVKYVSDFLLEQCDIVKV